MIDLRSLYPVDTETIVESIEKTGRLVVADESPLSYGTYAEIMARVNESTFYYLDAPMRRVGVPDMPIPVAPSLEDEASPPSENFEQLSNPEDWTNSPRSVPEMAAQRYFYLSSGDSWSASMNCSCSSSESSDRLPERYSS